MVQPWTDDVDIITGALDKIANCAPDTPGARAMRAALHRELLGRLKLDHAELGEAQGWVEPKLRPLISALTARPELLRDFYAVILNQLIDRERRVREAEEIAESAERVWTRHYRAARRRLQASARRALDHLGPRQGALARIRVPIAKHDGASYARTDESLLSLAVSRSGKGRRPEPDETRMELMRFLVGSLDLPVLQGCEATASLLALFFGEGSVADVSITSRAIERWWYRLPPAFRP